METRNTLRVNCRELAPPFPQSHVLLRFLFFGTYDSGHAIQSPEGQVFVCLVGWLVGLVLVEEPGHSCKSQRRNKKQCNTLDVLTL